MAHVIPTRNARTAKKIGRQGRAQNVSHIPEKRNSKKNDRTRVASSAPRSHQNDEHTPNSDASQDKEDADIDNFLNECMAQNILLEGCIIAACWRRDIGAPFQKDASVAKKARFAASEGDAHVVLQAMRAWVGNLRSTRGNSSSWCAENGIEENILKVIEDEVQKIYIGFKTRYLHVPRLNFNGNAESLSFSLTEVISRTRVKDICVYTGHDALGYKMVSTGKTVAVENASIFNMYHNRPKYIIPLLINTYTTSKKNVAGRKILTCNPEKADLNGSLVVVLPESMAESVLNSEDKGSSYDRSSLMVVNDIGIEAFELLKMCWTRGINGQPSISEKIKVVVNGDTFVAEEDGNDYSVRVFCNISHHQAIKKIINEEIDRIRSNYQSMSLTIPYPHNFSSSSAILGDGMLCREFLFPGESVSASIWSMPSLKTTLAEVQATIDNIGIDGIKLFESSPNDIREDVLGTAVASSSIILYNLLEKCQSVSTPFRIVSDTIPEGLNSICCHFVDNLSVKLRWKVHDNRFTKPKVSSNDVARIRGTLCRALEDLQEDKVAMYVYAGLEEKRRGLVRANLLFLEHATARMGLDMIKSLITKGLPLEIENLDEVDESLKSFQLTIRDNVFKVVGKALRSRLENFRLSNMYQAKYTIENCDKGYVRLNISAENAISCSQIMNKLLDTVSGTSLRLNDYDPDIRRAADAYFKSFAGDKFLEQTMIDTNTCVVVTNFGRELVVHGTKTAKKEAIQVLENKIGELAQMISGPFVIIRPREEGFPHDFFITMSTSEAMMKFFVEPDYMLVKSRQRETRKDIIRAFMKGYAKRQGIGKVDNTIDLTYADTESRVCVSCFLDLDPNDKSYVLEACGHLYCFECLQTQVNDAIRTTTFPVLCAHDNQPFSAIDFKNIAEKLHLFPRKRLLKASVRHFINSNPNTYKYCIRPDCPGVGRLRESSLETFLQCSTCSKKGCPKCLGPYHKFMTCAQAAESSFSLTEWLKEAPQRRKKCPNCKIGIEKIDGCNRVTCGSCGKHICWNCLLYFPTSRECYDHLSSKHGGYGF